MDETTQLVMKAVTEAILDNIKKEYPHAFAARNIAEHQFTGMLMAFLFDEKISSSEYKTLTKGYHELAKIEFTHGCDGCGARCDASNRHVSPIWRNVYCEDDHKTRSLTKENDKKSPDWCPRDE